MSARILAGLLASTVLAAVPLVSGGGPGAESQLRLAVLPCTNIESTFRKFHPLLAHLKSATGLSVSLWVPADLADFESTTANGQLDFALQDPHTYRQLSRLFDDASLLQTRALDGTTRQSAVVVVRRDSALSDLAELRGRTVLFGPRTSSPKWIAAGLLFESRGLRVDRDLKGVNGGCCEDIAFAVSVEAVEAGVICEHFLGQHGARQKDLGVDPASLRVIGRTPAFPTRIFAARKGVSATVVAAITQALTRLDAASPEHAGVMASAEIRGFMRTTRAEYLRELGRTAPPARP
jgi:phosphonate transport system substrate-binding protein